jgi:predicted nucleic acid-binding protein
MERYFIDTNVVSVYFSASLPATGFQFMNSPINAVPNRSVITQVKLFCCKTDTAKEQRVKGFIADSFIVGITLDVINHSVNIHRSKEIKTPDAIIAATALAHDYAPIPNNDKDFKGIRGLKYITPNIFIAKKPRLARLVY